MVRICKGGLLILLSLFAYPLRAEELLDSSVIPERPKEWSRAIRGFRREHNFMVNYGLVANSWEAQLAGYDKSFHFKTAGQQLGFDYSFHLPLWGGLGYVLGTKLTAVIISPFTLTQVSSVSFGLPGMNVGLVLNSSDHFRMGAGMEFGWHRIDRLRLPIEEFRKPISITGETRAYRLSADYFYELSWALHLEYEVAKFSYQTSESLKLLKSSRAWSVGVLKHLI